MSKHSFNAAFAAGLAAVAWVALGFVGTHGLALAVTLVIGAAYGLGAWELRQYRAATATLSAALADIPQPLARLGDWLDRVPASLRQAVRLRVEGERTALPAPALTPYLVGLLVMLGMLGTFLGMVVTFRGTVFALEGSGDLAAMRAALAEPIKGLGLSFGTSVAGVAASAMLGLMSAISRRERAEAGRALDACVGTSLRSFSPAQQREDMLRALQAQAGVLPEVAGRLDALMERLEARSRQIDEQLVERQARFQEEAARAYTALAQSVGASLKDSVAAGARAAGESVTPVVEAAMARIAQDTQQLHARLGDATQAQASALATRLEDSAREVAAGWQSALQSHARTSEALAADLKSALAGFSEGFGQRSADLLASIEDRAARAQAAQAEGEQARLQAWTGALQGLAADLQAQWQRAGELAIAQQQAIGQSLQQAADDIAERASAHAGRTLEEAAQLVARSEELVRTRVETEARWATEHGQRMDELAGLWRTELAALRAEEGARGQAAVDRLGALEGEVSRHLATLGAALEAPLTRLLATASEVPQAAAGVIAQLREEMGRMSARDNASLEERNALLAQLGDLLRSVQQSAGEQRAAIEALVASASTVLGDAGERFAAVLQAQAEQASGVSAQAGASAVELASVAEAFGQGVQAFQTTSERVVDSLERLEAAIAKSSARSDEQLAYYVAQAREVIDLSIASQQGLVENLRQLQVAPAEGQRA